jgi:hypothetical protein
MYSERTFRTHAINTSGIYILNPLFESQKNFRGAFFLKVMTLYVYG